MLGKAEKIPQRKLDMHKSGIALTIKATIERVYDSQLRQLCKYVLNVTN